MSAAHDHDHGHEHAHVHDHDHDHAAPVGGPAVLDIGGDVGALVLHLDRSHLGTEIHIRRAGRPADPTTHTGVWERAAGGRTMVVAVFAAVQEGRYDVLDAQGAPVMAVTITGGNVTETAMTTTEMTTEVIRSAAGGEVVHDHIVVRGGTLC